MKKKKRKGSSRRRRRRREKSPRFQTAPLPWFLGISTSHDRQEHGGIKFNISTEGEKREIQSWRGVEKYPII